MTRPSVLLITGLPATGKTTLARRLASRYGLPLLGKDLIKEPLLDVLGARDAADSRALSDASFAVLFAMARELSVAGSHMLLEGNFRPGAHEPALRDVLPWIESAQAEDRFAQVLCRAEESERRARLARRQSDPTRHPSHRDTGQASAPAAAAGDSFLDLPGPRWIHDGAAVHEVLAALDDWWKLRAISPKNHPAGEPRR